MGRKDMTSVKELLPRVLVDIARETGSASQLAPVWEELVGVAIARNARPIALQGRTLVVRVSAPAWARELEGREGELVKRLAEELGSGLVERIRLEVA